MAVNFVLASNQSATLSSSLGDLRNVSGGSLSLWFKATSFPASGERFLLVLANGLSGTSSRLSLSIRPPGSVFRTSSRRLDADAVTSLDSTGVTLTTGVIYHLCAVAEWGSGNLRLYINGVQNNSVAIGGWTGNSSNTASVAATMGTRSASENVDGVMDDARVYNRALTVNEVMNIYISKGRDTVVNGMVDRWKLMNNSVGSAMGTCPSIGSNQGGAVAVNTPLIAASLGIVTRSRRH